MTLHASMINNILLHTTKTLCIGVHWYHCSIEDPKNDSLSRQDFGSFGVTFLWIENHFCSATDPFSSAPTYLFDDLIEQLRVYILPVSSYSKSNPSSNFVYQPLLSISQASPIGFCCCCYCDFCAESVEYFVSLLLWLLDDNIDMNRSIVFQSL